MAEEDGWDTTEFLGRQTICGAVCDGFWCSRILISETSSIMNVRMKNCLRK